MSTFKKLFVLILVYGCCIIMLLENFIYIFIIKIMAKNIDKNLDPNEILIAEFNYAAQTAFQANEDRVRVFGYIIASLGTILAAIIVPNINSNIDTRIFGVIFLGLTIVGIFFLFQLSRLRIAWIESVRTMNQIKDYYIANHKEIDLYKAFKWRTSTIPASNKIWSLAFLLAASIISINTLSIGIACYLFNTGILFAVVTSLLFILLQILLWNKLIKG